MLYLCRLCLKKSPFTFSLFTGNISEKIESLASIKIVKGDKLPQTCCESCMANVYSAYKFQQCIIQSNNTLLEQYEIKPGEIKVEEVYIALEEEEEENVDLIDNYDSIDSYHPNDNNASEITDVVMLEEKDNGYELKFENEQVNEVSDSASSNDKVEEKKVVEDIGKKNDDKSAMDCTECGLNFTSKKLFQQHRAKHRVDNCPFCFVVMRRDNLKKHMQIHVESPEVCEICGKVAKNKESLRGHINYLHKKKAKTKCDYCEKEFKSTHHYNTHVRNVHLGIRNHQCHICGKKFFANHDLNKHINMTHKRARPYICPYCKKGFSSLYARKTHIRQHTHETPYMCEICDSGFRQKVSLVTHMKSKHPDEFELDEAETITDD
ncbi:hypothetical protein FQR65_LT04156 [Abscondita terminalis]|nr:hypothetical protein FQR65_LT04156 [Abscondita terminalis]